ncbi:MAG: LysM peptidoglycan-binding domain-containing protein [Anaerolineae bacterium]|nr:LysM peptidoglycan-binding domain-containing protein [Anaerolineae bacterium]
MSRFRRLSSLLIALTVVSVALGLSAPMPVQAQACAIVHVVRPGENLFRIGLTYGYSWTVLQRYNGLPNPNYIRAGQILCIPPRPDAPPVVVPTPPVVPPAVYYPPPGVFPAISFNTRTAGIGDTIVINGVRFPGNSTVDIFIAPRIPGVPPVYPPVASGTATVNADGTFSAPFTIPAEVGGVPLRGGSFSILVRARGSGFYGFNFVVNPRP